MNVSVELGGFLSQNGTYDYEDDYEYKADSEPEDSRAVLLPLLYSAVLLVGVLGNLLLLVILVQRRRSWSVMRVFILHLGVADVVLLATLPLRAALAAQPGRDFGPALCKISGAVFNVNFYCGMFLLACISVDHCLSGAYNTRLFSDKKPAAAHLSCLSAWLVSLVLSLPDWIFITSRKGGAQTCVHDYSWSAGDWRLISRLCHHTLGLLLPAAVLIGLILLRLTLKADKSPHKQTAATVLLALAAAFLLCWLPYVVTLIVDTSRNHPGGDLGEGPLNTALMATAALGCVHACLPPLLYFGLCGSFRKRTLALLTCAKDESKRSAWEPGVGEDALPDQSHEAEEQKQMMSVEHQMQSLRKDAV